ncbi:MAG TPA: hypothetical protein VFM05_01845 [Candidatus Saccharimonadales bacterium]|nr:hypothetical protein [Candidatus Saccharimonadales bacterium]
MKKRLGYLQILGVKPFGEPGVDFGWKRSANVVLSMPPLVGDT